MACKSTAIGGTALVLVLAGGMSTVAQNDADVEALHQLGALYEQAMNDDKPDLLAPHLHEQFSGVMLTNEPVASLQELKDYWSKIKEVMGEDYKYAVTLKPEPTVFFGDIALSQGNSDHRVTTRKHGEFQFSAQWTAISKKEDGKWKILRVQGSIDPIRNPFVVAALKTVAWRVGIWSSLVALVVGIGATLLIQRLRLRKPSTG